MVNTILIYPLVFTLLLNPSNLFNKSIYGSFDEGEKLYSQKNYKGALQTFLDAQVENPGDIKLKYNIANTQYKIKNYDEAIKGYLEELQKGCAGTSQGRLIIMFTITGSGSVKDVSIVRSELKDKNILQCVLQKIKKLSFGI